MPASGLAARQNFAGAGTGSSNPVPSTGESAANQCPLSSAFLSLLETRRGVRCPRVVVMPLSCSLDEPLPITLPSRERSPLKRAAKIPIYPLAIL
jgi:hypothetical protein